MRGPIQAATGGDEVVLFDILGVCTGIYRNLSLVILPFSSIDLTTHRDGGSSLRRACALFTGSYDLMMSSEGPGFVRDECDSRSWRSAGASLDAVPVDANRRAFRQAGRIDARTSLTANRLQADESSRRAIVWSMGSIRVSPKISLAAQSRLKML
jgi:hypothetical protein